MNVKLLTVFVISLSIFNSTVLAKIYTWDYLMSEECVYGKSEARIINPARYMHIVDLNNDDVNDLILSASLSHRGSGGLGYDIYLATEPCKYIRIASIQADNIAFDKRPSGNRLWWYPRIPGQHEDLNCITFCNEDYSIETNSILIYFGRGDEDQKPTMGARILRAIFTKESTIKFKKVLPTP